MSKVFTAYFGIALLLAAIGCKPSGGDSMGSMTNNSSASTMPAGMTYTCTMHPEVASDKPGKCPKCGMELVVKK